jgi:hypothetical protein
MSAVILDAYLQYLWAAEMLRDSAVTNSTSIISRLRAVAAWAIQTLQTLLARFERDYGEVLTRYEKSLVLDGKPPLIWDFTKPPEGIDYMERLVKDKLDRIEKARSKLPPFPTDSQEAAMESWYTIVKAAQTQEASTQARFLYMFRAGTRSLITMVDEEFNGGEVAPQDVVCDRKKPPADADLEICVAINSLIVAGKAMQLGDEDTLNRKM